MSGAPRLIDAPAEKRQPAREPLVFERAIEPYINWDAVAGLRRALHCDMRVSTTSGGNVEISFFWRSDPAFDDEAGASQS
jgi:hypothetical protein